MPLAATLIAALLVAAGGGGGTSTIDPSGDSGAAPDITGLDLAVDDNGITTFTVDVPLLDSDTTSVIYVYIDADTGSLSDSGADYRLEHHQSDHSFDFSTWNAAMRTWVSVSNIAGVSARHNSSGITFSVNRSRLGNASQINVFAKSVVPGSSDRAPNAGTIAFDLAPFTLDVVAFNVGTVKAGGQLTITMAATQSDNGKYADAVRCALTGVGSARTAAIISSDGIPTGTCIWDIPKKLKGKTLHASITEASEGRTVTKTATIRVR